MADPRKGISVRRKLTGFLLLAALSFALWTQTSTSQTAPSATLTLHDVSSTHQSLAGVDLSANTEVVGLRVWANGDSITWSLGYALPASWEIVESYESGGYSFIYARTNSPADGVREGHVLTAVYTATDSLVLLNAAPSECFAQYFYGGYRTNMTTSVAGSLEASAVPGVTFTLHPVSPYHSMLAGIDVSAPSDTVIMAFSVTIDEPLVASLTTGLPTPWYLADTVITDASTTTISASVADPDSGIYSGHLIDVAEYTGADTILITASTATWSDSSGTTVFTFATTNAGSHFASTDSMKTAPPTTSMIGPGRDFGKSFIYPASIPDTIVQEWGALGHTLGAPVYWSGNRVITAMGNDTEDPDSTFIACRVDSTGALSWKIALPDTAVAGYSWPVAVADSIIYGMRLSGETTENAIFAIRRSTGAVKWASATEKIVARSRRGPQPFTILSDGDIVAHDWQDASAPALVRLDHPDGSIVWSTILETNVVGTDTLDSDKKLATSLYYYNGTPYILAVGVDSRLNIVNATTGAWVDSTSVPTNVDTEIFLASNAAFCGQLTPPVVTLTTPYYSPSSSSSFAFYAGYLNGTSWTSLVSDWQTGTSRAPYTVASFIQAGYDSLLHGPIIARPGSTVLTYDIGRDVTNKSIAKQSSQSSESSIQLHVDSSQRAVLFEPETGLMQMFKSVIAVTDSAGYYAHRKWLLDFDPSPYARPWIGVGRRIYLNASGRMASYEQRKPGTTPPGGRHGKETDVYEP